MIYKIAVLFLLLRLHSFKKIQWKRIVTMERLSLIELITYEEHCFNVAFIFLSFRENI